MTRRQFILSRGWKPYLGSWWYKPLPGWNGDIAPNQEIFGIARAFASEQFRVDGEPPPDPPPKPRGGPNKRPPGKRMVA
jgi:hypothetical protein